MCVFLVVPAALCCAPLCFLRLNVAAAVCWHFPEGSARPGSTRFTPLIFFTMCRQVHTYIRKKFEIFRCACCAAVDQSKSEVATRAWNHDIYGYASNHVCCVIQTLGVCIIWAGPDHYPPYYKTNLHLVEDRVVDTYRRSSTRMRERTRHRSGNIRFRVTSGVTRHRRRWPVIG